MTQYSNNPNIIRNNDNERRLILHIIKNYKVTPHKLAAGIFFFDHEYFRNTKKPFIGGKYTKDRWTGIKLPYESKYSGFDDWYDSFSDTFKYKGSDSTEYLDNFEQELLKSIMDKILNCKSVFSLYEEDIVWRQTDFRQVLDWSKYAELYENESPKISKTEIEPVETTKTGQRETKENNVSATELCNTEKQEDNPIGTIETGQQETEDVSATGISNIEEQEDNPIETTGTIQQETEENNVSATEICDIEEEDQILPPAKNLSELDPVFDFLFKHENIVHSSLARNYERAAKGSNLYSASYCAKLLRKTAQDIRKNFESEFQENGILHNFNPEDLHDYITAVYGWELPHDGIIESIIKNCDTSTPILEIGSGGGLFSKILSNNFTVYPTDVFVNANREKMWMTPLIYPSRQSIPNNPHAFIFCTYPYKKMLVDILNLSAIGQRIALMISPIAGISRSCIMAILEQFTLLDKLYSITRQNYLTGKSIPPQWQGVIIEKTRKFEFNGDYTRDNEGDYLNWQDAVDGRRADEKRPQVKI